MQADTCPMFRVTSPMLIECKAAANGPGPAGTTAQNTPPCAVVTCSGSVNWRDCTPPLQNMRSFFSREERSVAALSRSSLRQGGHLITYKFVMSHNCNVPNHVLSAAHR